MENKEIKVTITETLDDLDKEQQQYENETSTLDQLLNNFSTLAAKVRVAENDISDLFRQMDTDDSGALDKEELKAFLQGRYNMSPDVCDIVFRKFDHDNNTSIDIEEFTKIIKEVNSVVLKFDTFETKATENFVKKVTLISCYSYCCCICTLGTSTCCANCCLTTLANGHVTRMESANTRLNMKIKEGLTRQEIQR